MRIKDKKLYKHLREHKILILPCLSTINGYLKHYGGAFGFQPQTFHMLKTKTADMQPREKHGFLLIDEMKLVEGAYFDASTLKVEGFVNLGERTHEALGEDFEEAVEDLQASFNDTKAGAKIRRLEKENEVNRDNKEINLGDHALVVTFQPFIGNWVQGIACFLTKGNASDQELTKIVLEALILLERSDLFVDAVVTDGATWNRSMWLKFGISIDNPSAEHPCDSRRRLWFISDFPHLMKCMRNCLCSKKIIQTPEGNVKLDHWKAVVEADSHKHYGLRECHKLTEDHLNPDSWQKMNVRMAWEFWSASAAAAMRCYKLQSEYNLKDCDASANLCEMINNLADAMNSRRPRNALRLGSPHLQAIQKFLEYFINLKAWANEKFRMRLREVENTRTDMKQTEKKKTRRKSDAFINNQEDFIFSKSTDTGVIVSLKGTLELVEYLIHNCNFQYIMTARLNQDSLERFFGLIRQSCGGNTHPDAKVFAQLFRLLSIYSLVKPTRGSNISGGEMLSSLLNIKDLEQKTREERHEALTSKLDEIVLKGENLDHIPKLMEHADHQYLQESVDEFALTYVAGFVARNCNKYAEACRQCQDCLEKSPNERTNSGDMLITLKSKGFYTYPSNELLALLRQLEEKVVDTCTKKQIHEHFLFTMVENIGCAEIHKIGCRLHENKVTKSVVKFYLLMRMHFIVNRWNERVKDRKEKGKSYWKLAHLT